MAFITHVSTAVPGHAISQRAAAGMVTRSLGFCDGRALAVHELFEKTSITKRHSALPIELIGMRRSLSETMELYRRHALDLAVEAARGCLDDAKLVGRDIDFVITSSCTGMLLPSLAALLVEPLGLRRDVRRLPITEVGCAGGASALARAQEFSMAFPRARVLVVAVELPTLTFQHDDASPTNVVASAIFGDGAAAALVEGEASRGVEVVATRTGIFPDSLGDMGFDLRDGGLHVVLSKNVPRIIVEHTPRAIAELLACSEVDPDDIGFYVLHPGGRKVLEALERTLGLDHDQTIASWNVLRDYGNQSSASVLFVLREALKHGTPQGYGLLAAFGPGITVELALLRGRPC
jgi:alkylresorcinol/alkylpyrone synthase